jgi:hypothetical protein
MRPRQLPAACRTAAHLCMHAIRLTGSCYCTPGRTAASPCMVDWQLLLHACRTALVARCSRPERLMAVCELQTKSNKIVYSVQHAYLATLAGAAYLCAEAFGCVDHSTSSPFITTLAPTPPAQPPQQHSSCSCSPVSQTIRPSRPFTQTPGPCINCHLYSCLTFQPHLLTCMPKQPAVCTITSSRPSTNALAPRPSCLRFTIGYATNCPGPWYVVSPPRGTLCTANPLRRSSCGRRDVSCYVTICGWLAGVARYFVIAEVGMHCCLLWPGARSGAYMSRSKHNAVGRRTCWHCAMPFCA